MRKWIAVLAVMMLAAVLPVTAPGEGNLQTVEFAMDLFEGVWGNTFFRLPGAPERIREEEPPDENGVSLWTDSWQLMGTCAGDGAEYQLHMADIAHLVEQMEAMYPEVPETQRRLQALMYYGMFIPELYGAEVSDRSIESHKKGDNLWMTVAFTYKDTPDLPYTGHFMLSGTKAACLVMAKCDHTDAVTEAMRIITDEEREAWLAEREQAVSRPLNGLSMTFPVEPVYAETENSEFLACFTTDWGMIQVQYMPVTTELGLTEAEIRESMETIARDRMLVPYESEPVNPVCSIPAEHAAQLDFSFINQSALGEYGQKMLGRLYVSENGVWYLYAPDDDAGRTFLAGTALEDQGKTTDHGGNDRPDASAGGSGDPDDQEAVLLPVFRERLEKLINEGIPDFQRKPDSLHWSEAVFTGGEWIRAVYGLEENFGAALIHLDSSREDAAVREIVMLCYSGFDGIESLTDDWRAFSGLCAAALCGDPEISVEHLDPEDSALSYDRVRLLPPGAVPPLAEDIPFPDGAQIEPIPDSGMTAKEFEERVRSLMAADMVSLMPEENALVYMLDGEAFMVVHLSGEGDDASVVMVMIMGTDEAAASTVVHGTVCAFGALAGNTPEENMMTSYALMETPMWDQPEELWPLLCRGNLLATLQGTTMDGKWLPMGFVAARP